MGNSLVICFIDFSKASDLADRKLMFYKIMKSGWHGRVMHTLRSLYRQTSCSVLEKRGWAIFLLHSIQGTNQCGIWFIIQETYGGHGRGKILEFPFAIQWSCTCITTSCSYLTQVLASLQKQLCGQHHFYFKTLTVVNELCSWLLVDYNVLGVVIY